MLFYLIFHILVFYKSTLFPVENREIMWKHSLLPTFKELVEKRQATVALRRFFAVGQLKISRKSPGAISAKIAKITGIFIQRLKCC